MQAWEHNNNNNFIAGWYLDNLDLVDRLRYHCLHSPDRGPAVTRYGNINARVKQSTDSSLNCYSQLFDEYKSTLQLVLNEYILLYPYCNNYASFDLEFPVMCQHYPVGGGFKVWHTERVNKGDDRHLVFMTYLDDIDESLGGGTEFYHQNLTVQPRRGLTLIWPADWTFTHRGIPASVEKCIVTGWFKYIK